VRRGARQPEGHPKERVCLILRPSPKPMDAVAWPTGSVTTNPHTLAIELHSRTNS
jgi:hypothetical protein